MVRPGQRFDLLGSGSALGAPLEGGVAVLVIQVDAEVCGLGALHLNSPSKLVLRPVFGTGDLIKAKSSFSISGGKVQVPLVSYKIGQKMDCLMYVVCGALQVHNLSNVYYVHLLILFICEL